MPIFLKKRRIQRILITFLVIMMILSIICVFYNWWLAIIHILVIISFYYLLIKADAVFQSEAEKYISLLSYRVKKVGEESFICLIAPINMSEEEQNMDTMESSEE